MIRSTWTALCDYVRSGEIPVELRASNTITGSTGSGAYLPARVPAIESAAKIPNSLKAAMAYYDRTPWPLAGKEKINVPVAGLAAGAAVAGDAEAETLATNTDGSLILTPATYESKTLWVEAGIAALFDGVAAATLTGTLQDACERGQEAAFYTASILTAGLKSAARETGTASVVKFTDLSALLFDLGAYASLSAMPAFLVSATALAAMHSMTDANNAPVNKLTVINGVFHWDGIPVFLTEQLEAMGDGKYVVAAVSVGAMAAALSNPILFRYAEHPARVAQVGFNLIQYAAFGIKASAVKLLKVKAA